MALSKKRKAEIAEGKYKGDGYKAGQAIMNKLFKYRGHWWKLAGDGDGMEKKYGKKKW